MTCDNAGGGNRTHTILLGSSDFKSDASASSATPAQNDSLVFHAFAKFRTFPLATTVGAARASPECAQLRYSACSLESLSGRGHGCV